MLITENNICSVPCSFNSMPTGDLAVTGATHLRLFSNWMVSNAAAGPQMSRCGPLSSQAEGSGVFQQLPWQYQQVRTKKRGTEYQPKNIKRKRTHGWIKRLSSRGGIEVLLRRMLKGRKSLSHWGFPLENLQDFLEIDIGSEMLAVFSKDLVYWVDWYWVWLGLSCPMH